MLQNLSHLSKIRILAQHMLTQLGHEFSNSIVTNFAVLLAGCLNFCVQISACRITPKNIEPDILNY